MFKNFINIGLFKHYNHFWLKTTLNFFLIVTLVKGIILILFFYFKKITIKYNLSKFFCSSVI